MSLGLEYLKPGIGLHSSMADFDETPDHRAQLMRAWSADKALMAQAGITLASQTAIHENEEPHFISSENRELSKLIHIAGVQVHTESHTNQKSTKKKRKNKANKTISNALTPSEQKIFVVLAEKLVKDVHNSGHGSKKKHKHQNPFVGAELSKLQEAYTQANKNLVVTVNHVIAKLDTVCTKFPMEINQSFLKVFQFIKQYRAARDSHTYQDTFEQISKLLTSYKEKFSKIRYILHEPHNVPTDRFIGTLSLLGKLIHATTLYLKKKTTEKEARTNFGVYELNEQLSSISHARNNFQKIEQALNIRENKHTTRDGTTLKIHDERGAKGRNGYYPSVVAGLHEDMEEATHKEGTFRMGQPFEEY